MIKGNQPLRTQTISIEAVERPGGHDGLLQDYLKRETHT